MNAKILLVAICAIAVSSCSTAYKLGQTPDDVYYSPATDGFVAIQPGKQAPPPSTYEDQSILMSIRDPRWRNFDYDYYGYSYTPYTYGYNSDYYYNPYYCSYPVYNYVVGPVNPVNTTPRMTNLSAYNNTTYNNSNQAVRMDKMNAAQQQRNYNNTNQPNTGVGNFLRQVFSPSGSGVTPVNNNNSNYTPANNDSYNDRNYSPVNTNSGGSSTGSSSGGAVSRPVRSGRN